MRPKQFITKRPVIVHNPAEYLNVDLSQRMIDEEYTHNSLIENAQDNLKEGVTFDQWSLFMKEQYDASNVLIDWVKARIKRHR